LKFAGDPIRNEHVEMNVMMHIYVEFGLSYNRVRFYYFQNIFCEKQFHKSPQVVFNPKKILQNL